jgi:hypothetical protein
MLFWNSSEVEKTALDLPTGSLVSVTGARSTKRNTDEAHLVVSEIKIVSSLSPSLFPYQSHFQVAPSRVKRDTEESGARWLANRRVVVIIVNFEVCSFVHLLFLWRGHFRCLSMCLLHPPLFSFLTGSSGRSSTVSSHPPPAAPPPPLLFCPLTSNKDEKVDCTNQDIQEMLWDGPNSSQQRYELDSYAHVSFDIDPRTYLILLFFLQSFLGRFYFNLGLS